MRLTVVAGPVRWILVLVVAAAVALPLAAKDKKGKKAKEPEKPVPVEPVWPSPLDPGKIDPVFKELPFNQPQEKFAMEFRSRLQEQLKPVLRATPDPVERDALNSKMLKAIQEVDDSYTEFVGQQTGYSVSVVSDEYQDMAGESLYKYAYAENTAYFLFSGKVLWKMFICSESNRDFPALLIALSGIFGDPKDVQFEDEEKTKPVFASWRDTTFELAIEPPKGIFTCSRLKWTYVPLIETVSQRRTAAATAQGTGSLEDSVLKQVTEDEDADSGDIVDKILEKKKNKQK